MKFVSLIAITSVCPFIIGASPTKTEGSNTKGLEARVYLIDGNQALKMDSKVPILSLLLNEGRSRLIYKALSVGRGINVVVTDENGNKVKPLTPMLLPPPGPPPISEKAFSRLNGGNAFGVISRIPVKELVSKPGEYSLRITISPPVSRKYLTSPDIVGEKVSIRSANAVKFQVS